MRLTVDLNATDTWAEFTGDLVEQDVLLVGADRPERVRVTEIDGNRARIVRNIANTARRHSAGEVVIRIARAVPGGLSA